MTELLLFPGLLDYIKKNNSIFVVVVVVVVVVVFLTEDATRCAL